jgi:predicted GNAT family acetyltransferase
MDVEVVNVPAAKRYEARVNGEVAGFAAYRVRPDAIVFTHTEIDAGFEGKGIGSVLARRALDDVRANGGLLVPLCPFIADFIRRHPDYRDLVDPKHIGDIDESD